MQAFSTPPGDIRVTVWDEVEQRKVSGPAAPTEDNLCRFLEDNPRFSIYAGQTAVHSPSRAAAQALQDAADVECCRAIEFGSPESGVPMEL